MEFRDKPMQNLIRVKEKEICKNVQELLLDGEQIVGAYKTVRDQAVFTSSASRRPALATRCRPHS